MELPFRAAVFAALGCAALAACGDGTPASPPAPSAPPPPAPRSDITLSIAWGDWEPADQLHRLARGFTAKTGIGVDLHKIAWPKYQQTVFTEFTGAGTTFDLVVGDSQWLGKGASEGHYLDLTDWMKANVQLEAIVPAALAAYCEYPKGSGRYWAIPGEGDACGWAYRRDLFEDPAEKAAFKAKYGYELDIPRTWEALRDAAEFFTRPDRKDAVSASPAALYGVALWLGKEYDGVTMGFQQAMWSWGGEYGEPATNRVKGIVNAPACVEALDYYRGLVAFSPPGSTDGYWEKTIQEFQTGRVAMAMNYFAFFPGLTDPKRNPHAKATGFFAGPAKKGKEALRAVSLGGQGLSIVSYIAPARQEAAKQFLKWFAAHETQVAWAQAGGLTCDRRVLSTEGFLNATPYNRAYAESLPLMRDFWTVPEYAKLLEVTQKHWHAAVTGALPAKDALDRVADEHDKILREGGRIKE